MICDHAFTLTMRTQLLGLAGTWVAQQQNDRVASHKQLADVAVLGDGLGLLLALASLGHLQPHLLHVLKHLHVCNVSDPQRKGRGTSNQVAVAVKCAHAAEKLFVVAAEDHDLVAVLNSLDEYLGNIV